MDYAFLGIVAAVLLGSITSLWTVRVQATHRMSLDSLWVLVQWYLTMLLGFAMIYMILQVNGHAVFTPSPNSASKDRLSLLEDSFVFEWHDAFVGRIRRRYSNWRRAVDRHCRSAARLHYACCHRDAHRV
ncbi:hypothetical protein LR69_02969 [Geobacillus sp. BCO2]|nr:hypothetical protein LR69_02969 [Geobacillus sp. BCO2]